MFHGATRCGLVTQSGFELCPDRLVHIKIRDPLKAGVNIKHLD